MSWQLAEAKNKFSEVVRRALTEGPQRITRRNDAVIVLSEAEYERLSNKHRKTFVQFLMDGPRIDDLEIERDKSAAREIDL